jgi:hypothetical protein
VVDQVEHLGRLAHLLVDLRPVDALELEREAHVARHRHVRIQRVVLEHHRDVAVLRRLVVDDVAVDLQVAVGDVLEPGDHAQRGRLPAPRRPDEDHELAVLDLQVERLHGLVAVVVALGHVVEDDVCHNPSIP